MKKRIAIIGTVGVPACYGGFETLAENLTKHLGQQCAFTVYCSSKAYREKVRTHNGAKLVYLPLNANGVSSIFYDIASIFLALAYADVLLILGVSGCVCLPLIRLFSRKKVIVNVDGLEWKRDKWNHVARWFLKFSEKMAVQFSDVIIADNKKIQDYIRETYGKESSLITYGGDNVLRRQVTEEALKKWPFLRSRYALTVCRIDPENNLEMILKAMSGQSELSMIVVGNWNGNQYARDLKKKYAEYSNIQLIDAIYDPNDIDQIRSNASIYLHGHSAGGTNPSLVEAMFLGLPILAYGVDYNKETTEYNAWYFHSADELLKLVSQTSQTAFKSTGDILRSIALRRYRWEAISQQYFRIF